MIRRDLTFRVFVSSTFSDLVAERNALQEHVFPRLREFCRKHGAQFQAVDLRFRLRPQLRRDKSAFAPSPILRAMADNGSLTKSQVVQTMLAGTDHDG